MVTVVNWGDHFTLRWCCHICHERCRLETLWLAFPATAALTDAPLVGLWVHRPCLDGHVDTVFATPHVTMMRGLEAIRHLAESLQEPVAIDR